MKILIYSFNDKIGDGLQKITFIQKIKEIYPDSYITYTTTNTTTLKNQLNSLIKNCIDEFIEFNEIDSSFLDLFKKKNKFKDRSYDLIIDLQKIVLRTLNLKKITHKLFFSTAANFLFSDYKNKNNYKFKGIYIERFYFNMVSILINEKLKVIPDIKLPKTNFLIKNISANKNKNIGIAPGAGDILRQWGFEKYLEVAKELREKGYNVYFFLGPDEKEYLSLCLKNNFLCPEWDNGKKISNNIVETMTLAKQMKCLLCNDGGTAWIFEFAGVKTFKIFGLTDDKKFARPNYSKTIHINDYGYDSLQSFPVNIYTEKLNEFLDNFK